MVTPFVRVDVSNSSRDFEPTILEPGLPLLDERNSRYTILRRWLGAFVAEPERKDNEIGFYLTTPSGARIERAECLPVSEDDLKTGLKQEFEKLFSAVAKAETRTSDEQKILAVVRQELGALQSEARKHERSFYLFKYRDANRQLRLVWCPGFHRKDADPSPPVVCTNGACLALFVRRGGSRQCPVCQVRAASADERKPSDSRRGGLLIATALLLIVALGGWYRFFGPGVRPSPDATDTLRPAKLDTNLVVSPGTWSGPVGGRIEFTVKTSSAADEVVLIQSDNPRVLTVDEEAMVGTALSPGTATLTFKRGSHSRQVVCIVSTPTKPEKLLLEPDKLMLGRGTTARIHAIGLYADERRVDLSEVVEWSVSPRSIVSLYKGLLEGMSPGGAKVQARYRASPKELFVEASANVSVVDLDFKTLKLELERSKIAVGESTAYSAKAATKTGEWLSAAESSFLDLKLEPNEAIVVHGTRIQALKPGQVQITGRFLGLADTVKLEVVAPTLAASVKLAVKPDGLGLTVGEIASLSIQASASDLPLRVVSSRPDVVQVNDFGRLVGRSAGQCQVDIIQGQEIVSVPVTVTPELYNKLAFVPARISVPIGDSTHFRIVGKTASREMVEIAPEVLDWIGLPQPDVAVLDRAQLQAYGLKPTGADLETLSVRFAGQEAKASLEVLATPLRLELSAEGSQELPVGQKIPLKVLAYYGGSHQEELPAERITFEARPVEGLVLLNGEVHAVGPSAGVMEIKAHFGGAVSNQLSIHSEAAVPLKLELEAVPSSLPVGVEGKSILSATGPKGPVSLSQIGSTYSTSDAAILAVDSTTGAFQGLQAGKAVLTATHPTAAESAHVNVVVVPKTETKTSSPKALHLAVDQPQPIQIALGAAFTTFRVEAEEADGSKQDVTAEAVLTIDGDAAKSSVAVRQGQVLAERPGSGSIRAEYAGVKSAESLAFEVTSEPILDKIQLSPSDLTLAVGESPKLTATGFEVERNAGILNGVKGLQWNVESHETSEVLSGVGPLSDRRALRAGEVVVTAQLGKLVSNPTTIHVVEKPDQIAEPLTVSPAVLRLSVGESQPVGRGGVSVNRASQDVTDQARVSSAADDILRFDDTLRALRGRRAWSNSCNVCLRRSTGDDGRRSCCRPRSSSRREPRARASRRYSVRWRTSFLARI